MKLVDVTEFHVTGETEGTESQRLVDERIEDLEVI